MEDLNKHQIILLCLLLSFVTSIGTGVITFSLLSEVPTTVTQTINRVVEKTIEKVVPVENQANVSQVTVKETVVVKEEDLIIDAVSKNIPKIVRVSGVHAPEVDSAFYGLGVVVKNDGLIVVPAKIIEEGVLYSVQFENGKVVPVESFAVSNSGQFVFLKPTSDIRDLVYSPVSFSDNNSLKLGQSVVVVAGETNNAVTLARVSAFSVLNASTTAQSIEIDVIPNNSAPGESLFNLSGEYVGMGMVRGTTNIVSADFIKQELDLLEKAPKH